MAETVLLLIKYKYLVLFPIAAIEGLVVSLAAGFLVYTGVLHMIPTYIILILGDFIPDSIYYSIGRLGNKEKILAKYGTKIKFIHGGFQTIEHLWKSHPRKTMLFAKVTVERWLIQDSIQEIYQLYNSNLTVPMRLRPRTRLFSRKII